MAMTKFGALALTAALGTATALPSAASAETQQAPVAIPRAYVLNVVSHEDYHGGEYDGLIRMTVDADGIVNGTYQASYSGGPEIVSGGVRPNGRIWLDIGHEHLTGTFVNGILHTTASIPEPETLHVDATPVH